MRRCCLILLVLTIPSLTFCKAEPSAYGKAAQSNVKVEWLFDIKMDNSDNTPRGKVYLMVGNRKVLIRPDVVGEYHVIERADYKSSKVPASAITACGGWWAGQGEDLYVIRRKRQLVVFIRYLDEGAPVPAYRRLKIIPLPR